MTTAGDTVAKVHHLPCNIEHTGTAPVASYFMPNATGTIVDGLPIQEAAFRGRRLKGVQLPLPSGFCGRLLQRASAGNEDKQPWSFVSFFDNFTYWNHDATPTKTDPLRKVVDWLELSQKLHCPITADQIQAKIQQKGL